MALSSLSVAAYMVARDKQIRRVHLGCTQWTFIAIPLSRHSTPDSEVTPKVPIAFCNVSHPYTEEKSTCTWQRECQSPRIHSTGSSEREDGDRPQEICKDT